MKYTPLRFLNSSPRKNWGWRTRLWCLTHPRICLLSFRLTWCIGTDARLGSRMKTIYRMPFSQNFTRKNSCITKIWTEMSPRCLIKHPSLEGSRCSVIQPRSNLSAKQKKKYWRRMSGATGWRNSISKARLCFHESTRLPYFSTQSSRPATLGKCSGVTTSILLLSSRRLQWLTKIWKQFQSSRSRPQISQRETA